jgi:hypothetical protein
MNTDDLVRSLAHDLKPAVPLRRPALRASMWFAGAAAYVAALAVGMGFANGSAAGADATFWAVQVLAIAASVLASAAAFASVVPGAPSRLRAFAVAAAAAWFVTLAATSVVGADWEALPAATHEWWCVGFIVAGGAPLLGVLAWMLRRGAPLNPATTAAFAALSVAALANVGACISLPHANDAVTLAWHGGAIAAVTVCAASCGRLLFSWRHARPAKRELEGW